MFAILSEALLNLNKGVKTTDFYFVFNRPESFNAL